MKTPSIGDIVKFNSIFTKVTNVGKNEKHTLCYILEKKDGTTAGIPHYAISWNGKQFIVNQDKLF